MVTSNTTRLLLIQQALVIQGRKCGDNFQVNVSGEEQASGFDECC